MPKPINSFMPSDEDIQHMLAEMAKHNPMELPKTMIQIQFAKMLAQEFGKFTDIYHEAVDEFNRKVKDWWDWLSGNA